MKSLTLMTLVLTALLFLSGCASYYRPIHPPTVYYTSVENSDGISFSYRYNVLREKGNKKYAKKEDKKGLKVIAVKFTNNTDTTINIGTDISFYSGQNQVYPLEPMMVKNIIKQIVPGYLPYLLLSPLNIYYSNGSTTQTYRTGLILGPGLAIGNMTMAGSANKQLLSELNLYNILYRDVQKGETIYGLIGIRDFGYDPITVAFKPR